DTVIVKAGTYKGFQVTTDGTPSARITFSAEPGVIINNHNAVTYDGINLELADYITIEGFTIRQGTNMQINAGIRSVENDGVIIRNNTVDFALWFGIETGFSKNVLIEKNTINYVNNQHGIYVGNSADNPIVRNNIVHDAGYCGIQLNSDASMGGDGIITGALVEGNILYNNSRGGGAAMNFDGVQNSIIRNNLLYNNTRNGIALYQMDGAEGAKNNTIINNTIVNITEGYYAMTIMGGDTDDSTGNKILNNILVSPRGSIQLDIGSLPGTISDYNIVIDRFNTEWNDDAVIDFAGWRNATGQDAHSFVASVDSLFADLSANDYRLSPTSPAIDAGSPQTYFLREPAPNGSRVNIGHQGNTPQATPSRITQSVQLLSPNGGKRFELGQALTIAWRSTGLTNTHPTALINAGASNAVGDFLPDAYQALAGSNGSFDYPVDVSALADPAPAEVYKTYASAQPGIGKGIAWHLPVPDGNYTLRLHFAEPLFAQPGQRQFDIRLQGTTVASAFDIAAAAQVLHKAVSASFSVVASGNAGINVSLINLTDNPAILSAIELVQADSTDLASPTVNLEFSTDDGLSWQPLASQLPIDRFGRGSYQWIPTALSSSTRIRITTNTSPVLSDVSLHPFQIVNNGHDYYINDDSAAGDVFTSAPGNDANTGKSPSQPMASLAALLTAYDLSAGDVIHVDTGTYYLTDNILLGAQHSGLRIEGPANATALLNRATQVIGSAYTGRAIGSYVFELRGASDITLDHLSLTGGQYGLYASDQSDSDRLTVSNCTIFGNDDAAIWLGSASDYATLSANTLFGLPNDLAYDDQACGISIAGSYATLTGNTLHDNALTGIRITGPNATVSSNTVSRSRGTGIYVAAGSVTDNIAHHNGIGMALTAGSIATHNTVYDNYDGIITADSLGPGPFTLWNDSIVPAVPAENDNRPVEVGIRFRTDVPGYITGIRFYKGPGNTGTHIGSLWDNLRIIGTASDDTLSLKPARLFFGRSVITYDNLESIRLDTLAGDDTLTLTAILPFAPIFNPGDGSNTLSIRA
ncbi:MAG TPA: right-handed parallel beta-helix repeat-containing protein, partial [Tepidisphaeraceae bacterium]|nr:right-handed parallel beta-helix repeat-containing protein [Tepidisphaeraceae bacterium]